MEHQTGGAMAEVVRACGTMACGLVAEGGRATGEQGRMNGWSAGWGEANKAKRASGQGWNAGVPLVPQAQVQAAAASAREKDGVVAAKKMKEYVGIGQD